MLLATGKKKIHFFVCPYSLMIGQLFMPGCVVGPGGLSTNWVIRHSDLATVGILFQYWRLVLSQLNHRWVGAPKCHVAGGHLYTFPYKQAAQDFGGFISMANKTTHKNFQADVWLVSI